MVRTAKKRRSANDPALEYFPVFDARAQLVNSMLSIGWRLALTVLVPVFAGIWADSKFNTKPSFTLAAFFVAIFASALMISKMYKELQAQASKLPKSRRKQKVIKGYDDNDDY